MKTIFFVLAALLFAHYCISQVTSIEVEPYFVHTGPTADGVDLTGYTTYRLYAICTNPSDVVNSTALNYLNLESASIVSDSLFWQSPMGNVVASSIDCALLSAIPSLQYDSWITIGCTDQCSCTTPTNIYEPWYNPCCDSWTDGFELNGNALVWYSDFEGGSGHWSVPSNSIVAISGDDLKVLLGQFTTNGFFHGHMWFDNVEHYFCGNTDCILGCTIPIACNYDSMANMNNGTCVYSGCTDALACNYSSYAGCDNGSCYYPDLISGVIFHDVNGNGYYNSGFFSTEPGLSGWSAYILENEIYVYSDNEGQFTFPDLAPGTYTIEIIPPNDNWINSTPISQTVTLPVCDPIQFGFTPASEVMAQISGPCCIWMMDIHCQNGFNPGLWIQNTGNVPLNGTFTITCDELFVAEYLTGTEFYDSFIPGTITWNIADQPAGSSFLYQCHIVGPGVEYLGQQFDYNMHLILTDDEGNVVYENNWLLQPEVVCSYDPNDKYAEPMGYTDEHHFVLAENEIEYRIRFQNTGNAPAEKVIVEDQLDPSTLDLTTFEPVFGSHSFYTTVEPDGLVRFVFDGINLPDSASDEPGSQGYVVFRIKPIDEILPGTEINNTASIFFDNNPPIVTNTTWHTIFDCNSLGFAEESEQVCDGENFTTEFNPLYVEEQVWNVNSVEVADGSMLNLPELETGLYSIEHIASNPLCEVSSTINLEVTPNPEVTITYEDFILSAPEGYTYEWWLNGELIPGETTDTLDPWLYVADGMSAYVIVTDSNGCQGISNTIFDGAVGSLTAIGISLFPNPFTQTTTLKLPTGIFQITLINSMGQQIKTWNNIQHQLQIKRERLAAGNYLVRVVSENGKSDEVKLMIE